MITAEGYSKDPNIMPEGIAVTFGKDMIADKGGLLKFMRWFNYNMDKEDGIWYHKMKNTPTQDIIYVYVIICNRVYCRAAYGGKFKEGVAAYLTPNSKDRSYMSFSGIALGGPIVKAPRKIIRPGFQGFRYTTKLF